MHLVLVNGGRRRPRRLGRMEVEPAALVKPAQDGQLVQGATRARHRRSTQIPKASRLPAGHKPSPTWAFLPGADQPTMQADTAKPEPHCTPNPPYSAGGRACRARAGCGRQPARRNGQGVLTTRSCRHVGVGARASFVCALPRVAGYWASLDASRGPTSAAGRRVPSSSLRRRAFSRSSSATRWRPRSGGKVGRA
jgi:hypothetical protein